MKFKKNKIYWMVVHSGIYPLKFLGVYNGRNKWKQPKGSIASWYFNSFYDQFDADIFSENGCAGYVFCETFDGAKAAAMISIQNTINRELESIHSLQEMKEPATKW